MAPNRTFPATVEGGHRLSTSFPQHQMLSSELMGPPPGGHNCFMAKSAGGIELSPAERAVLERYVTNLDGRVFALRDLPEVVKGALFSRYSRTEKSLRRVLVDEFLNEPDAGLDRSGACPAPDGLVASDRAEGF